MWWLSGWSPGLAPPRNCCNQVEKLCSSDPAGYWGPFLTAAAVNGRKEEAWIVQYLICLTFTVNSYCHNYPTTWMRHSQTNATMSNCLFFGMINLCSNGYRSIKPTHKHIQTTQAHRSQYLKRKLQRTCPLESTFKLWGPRGRRDRRSSVLSLSGGSSRDAPMDSVFKTA